MLETTKPHTLRNKAPCHPLCLTFTSALFAEICRAGYIEADVPFTGSRIWHSWGQPQKQSAEAPAGACEIPGLGHETTPQLRPAQKESHISSSKGAGLVHIMLRAASLTGEPLCLAQECCFSLHAIPAMVLFHALCSSFHPPPWLVPQQAKSTLILGPLFHREQWVIPEILQLQIFLSFHHVLYHWVGSWYSLQGFQ